MSKLIEKQELTFFALLQTIRHEMRKGQEERVRLFPKMALFADYCRKCKHYDILGVLENLQKALTTGSIDEIKRQCDALEKLVEQRRLTNTAPGIKNHEVLLYHLDTKRLGLLFTHQAVRFAMAALIRNLFCYIKISRQAMAGELKDSDIVLCDGDYGIMLKATAIHYQKCIIVDPKPFEATGKEIFISLPLTPNGLQTLSYELLSFN
jgi:hypothetical protein